MHPIAVGRFDQQVVGLVDHRRIRENGTAEPAEVATKKDGQAVRAYARVRRAQKVTGVDEVDLDAVGHRHRAVIADRLQLRNRAERVGLRVERQCWRVLRVRVPIGVLRVFLLDTARVRQHDATEILRAGRAEDAAAETLRDETRQVTAVIEVRVRQDDGRNVRGLDRKVEPVTLAKFLEPLEQPAVNQHARGTSVEQMFGASDGAGGAEKCKGGHASVVSRQSSVFSHCSLLQQSASASALQHYANIPTCPPVCQKRTVSASRKAPLRTRAISPAIAFAVYVWSRNSASVRASSAAASIDFGVGTP